MELSNYPNEKNEEFIIGISNDMNDSIRLQWFNPCPEEKDYDFGILKSKEVQEMRTRKNHIWYARDLKTKEILQSFSINGPGGIYQFRPQPKKEAIDAILNEGRIKFLEEYFKKNNREWISVFPRTKLMHPIWDTIKIGHKQKIQSSATLWNKDTNKTHLDKQTFTLETISESPRIFIIKDCLSSDEVNEIIKTTDGRLARSTIVNEDGSGLIESNIRTSSTCWIRYSENEVIENIFDRISDILRINRDHVKFQSSEMLQVVHYEKGQEFKYHHDYLDPVSHYGNNSVMRGNNRMATFLFCLKTPIEGGETEFPYSTAGKDGKGLKVKVSKGTAILFYSMLPDGNLDVNSFHAGLPVEKGEKYIANLWVWDRVYK